ncbi:MAG TPA: ABC-F family ATP-binding cassette domain-containing protein [Gemmatimonadaceae bacterium]|nr:ABC-F family ATP-binding cassette domain-containing protein [Gemmatimonadaceae bacterium]
MTLISLSNVGVEFGATTLLTNVTFTVAQGDRWGIVGRNGTGKTTLFKLITGAQQPTSGAIAKSPGVRIALLDQHRDFAGATTVWEAAAGQFADLLALEQSLADQANQLGELGERCTQQMLDTYAHDLERFERDGGYTFAPRVDAVLHGLGFDPVEARTRPLEHLSGGERGRVGLARQLVSPADVLLLDEPTNHLDLDTTQWLESYLRETDKTILLISHDRAFLAAVVDHVLHVEGNSVVPYIGGYEQFVLQRTERRLAQQRAFQKQSRVIADESDYIRRNIAGQNSKQAKGRRKRLERIARLSPPLGEDGSMSLRLDVQERGGDQVIVADHATIAVESRTLIRDLSAVVKRGDRLGLIGPNGAGKSTFLKTLMGERAPVSGTVTAGNSITVAYYRQDLAQVPADKTLYDVISDLRPYWERGLVYGHLGRFGFSGDETQRKATTLSGGERARVALAMIMLSRANLLIFDEPTNHLDVESIEALEDAIESYEGTVLLVSHDRALLRALCTRVWVLHDTRVTDFDGTFAEWEVASEERAHAARVAAAEEESLRRVHEQQKTRRQNASTENDRVEARRAKRAVEEAEALVERLEAEVAELTKALEDPDLYTTPAGTTQSIELGKTLERRKHELEDAIRRWSTAVDQGQR